MSKLKVALVANDMAPTPEWVVRQLAEQAVELTERACRGPDDVADAAEDADVVWVMGGSRIVTADVLARLRRCRVILRTGAGTDNIPVDEAHRLGILVANTPEATMHQVAEHAVGLLLAVVRQIPAQDRLVRQGVWDRNRAWPDWSLTGRTFGLVGFGRIARLVAHKVSGFDMTVLAFDPAVDTAEMSEHSVEKSSLEELLKRSDFVSLHVPLTEGSRHLIGEKELRQMKPRAILINTARGSIIDEAALVRALREGWIAGAGLDVLESEPATPDHPLLSLDTVVVTPHIASYSDRFAEAFWSHSVRTLIEIAQQRPPHWCVYPHASKALTCP
jgi:D-3-phosphoglycerate dehydrogenase / 2-oxoglutarate reductase